MNEDDIFAGPIYPKGSLLTPREKIEYIGRKSESPIESALARQLLLSNRYVPMPADVAATAALPRYTFAVSMQHAVDRYRLDFALFFHDLSGQAHKVNIECDGWQYHSSGDAIIRDAKRDAALSAAGFEIWRYAGWIIHKASGEVADEIERALIDICQGDEPSMPFLRNRGRKPTRLEMEAAFYAFQASAVWPNGFGPTPAERGWNYVDQVEADDE